MNFVTFQHNNFLSYKKNIPYLSLRKKRKKILKIIYEKVAIYCLTVTVYLVYFVYYFRSSVFMIGTKPLNLVNSPDEFTISFRTVFVGTGTTAVKESNCTGAKLHLHRSQYPSDNILINHELLTIEPRHENTNNVAINYEKARISQGTTSRRCSTEERFCP